MLELVRRKCPDCDKQTLKQVHMVEAIVTKDNLRTSDSWSYHLCESCNARYKYQEDRWWPVSESEWESAVVIHGGSEPE